MTDEATLPPARPRNRPAAAPAAPAAVEGPASSETVTLDFPIEVASTGATVSELTMRRPTLRDRMNVTRMHKTKGADEQEIIFLANLCGVGPGDIENLDLGDYTKLQDTLAGFMPSRA